MSSQNKSLVWCHNKQTETGHRCAYITLQCICSFTPFKKNFPKYRIYLALILHVAVEQPIEWKTEQEILLHISSACITL